ncbi:MAG: hypothetical protein BZ137_00630 [Methanosphaera sp. rholeuAM130]|nr:MAG: hypothetical protein BZ137_00630 [Methanosphaera sp. rholeuAM130]
MKFKSVFLVGVLLLAFLSVSAIYADDTVVYGKSSFSIPDGYTLMEQDNQMVMYNDDYVMSIYEGSIIDTSKARDNRIKKGYNLVEEKNYTLDGIKINQQSFNSKGYNCLFYTFKKNNKNYIVSLAIDENKPIPADEDNPAIGIIKSLT